MCDRVECRPLCVGVAVQRLEEEERAATAAAAAAASAEIERLKAELEAVRRRAKEQADAEATRQAAAAAAAAAAAKAAEEAAAARQAEAARAAEEAARRQRAEPAAAAAAAAAAEAAEAEALERQFEDMGIAGRAGGGGKREESAGGTVPSGMVIGLDGTPVKPIHANPNHAPWLTAWLSGGTISHAEYQRLTVAIWSEPAPDPAAAAAEMAALMNQPYKRYFAGYWEGSGSEAGWRYSIECRLRPVRGRAAAAWPAVPAGAAAHMEGFILWTLEAHPASRPEYAARIGTQAVEVVAGLTTRGSRREPQRIHVVGYRLVDPNHARFGSSLIGIAEYVMKVGRGRGRQAWLTGASRGADDAWGNLFHIART